MKKSLSTVAVIALLLALVVITGTGCSKKVTPPPAVTKTEPPPPPPPPPPAPTIRLSASPSTIERGQSATLTWNSTNANNVSIDGGIGTVEANGSRSISPTSSATFKASASGAGGNAVAETRVTVTEPPEVAPPPPRTITDSEFFTTNVKDAFFDYDKYDIREDAKAALQSDARAFAERAGIRFTIEGHCDERGSEKYNLALGDKRANSAKQYLVSQGVAADRVDTMSFGEERPFCSEHSEDCWQQNRRAHLVLR